jgi:hypothetical protein
MLVSVVQGEQRISALALIIIDAKTTCRIISAKEHQAYPAFEVRPLGYNFHRKDTPCISDRGPACTA